MSEIGQSDFYVIEPAVLADAAVLDDIRFGSWLATYVDPDRGVTREALQHSISRSRSPVGIEERWQRLERSLEPDADVLFRVARIVGAGTVAGYVEGRRGDEVRQQRRADGAIQSVSGLHVLTSYQNRGIGSRLLSEFDTWADPEAPTEVGVVAGTPAIGFYGANGFVDVGQAEQWEILQMNVMWRNWPGVQHEV